MKDLGIKTSIVYQKKYLIANDSVDFFSESNTPILENSDEGILAFSASCFDKITLKQKKEIFYLRYFDIGSKRISFRAAKLAASSIFLLSKYEKIDKMPPFIQANLVKKYSELFSTEITGLSSYNKLKKEIELLFKEYMIFSINEIRSKKVIFKLEDIQKGIDFSCVHKFNVSIKE